ncbi:alcohol dehydrogenase catalytic domain-containing protein [Massilia sp. PWRC2]|uniref:alcohol dehydrogenase catalytic domain-containing protein n=1 Tax=Massilia sp. PWRC2 TaxID=2804626 RepID=UPI003CF189D4
MRALLLKDYAEGTFIDSTMARPLPRHGEVLVKVIASGVNPIDRKIRIGAAPHATRELPAILGADLTGVIEQLGAGVTDFKAGDEVCGMSGGVRDLPGSLAEYVAVDASTLAHKPASLSMREAAALPLVFLTAWEGLVDRAKVAAGQRVLLHAGAGGVGHVAVQIARARGAEVFATASAGKHAIVRGFGATPIDYKAGTVADYVAAHADGVGFDVVYDTVGGASLEASLAAATCPRCPRRAGRRQRAGQARHRYRLISR